MVRFLELIARISMKKRVESRVCKCGQHGFQPLLNFVKPIKFVVRLDMSCKTTNGTKNEREPTIICLIRMV